MRRPNESECRKPSPYNLQSRFPDRVEVLSFHTRRRCPTCRAIERLTREVVAGTFARQVADKVAGAAGGGDRAGGGVGGALRRGVVVAAAAWAARDGADTVVNLTRPAFDNARTNPKSSAPS